MVVASTLLRSPMPMQSRHLQPLVEAFLLVEQPRQRLSHWTQALGPLDDHRAPPLATITGYYDPATDQALIGLRYDPRALGAERLAFVIDIALLAEIGMIQPAELTDGERRRFLIERLARCTILVAGQRTVADTLTELVRRIREQRTSGTRPPPVPSARGLPTRGEPDDPQLLVRARGTRDDLPPPELPRATREQLRTQNDLAQVIEPPVARATSSSGLPRHRIDADAAAMSMGAAPATLPPAPRRGRSESQLGREPYLPSPSTPRGIIYARYLRSGRWIPIRIGALSLKGAALMAGALPRLNDQVDIALAFGTHRALVRGSVGKVSTEHEAQLTGAATFSVGFQLDDASKRHLASLLTAARAANVMITPPPARSARRYPVEWPVCLGTPRGAVRGDALDVSREGMFVKPQHALSLEAAVSFSSVLDDDGAPVSGRAQVVRHISEAEARACGLVSGFGVQITHMGEDDRARWLAFLARIEHRAEKRVLIGAAPARLAELQASLAAVGYAVTGGTDPGALVQLASSGARPVDAALIDAQWLTAGMSESWVESLFSSRRVPCVTLRGDVRRARPAIDKLLAVDGSSQRG